MTFSNKMHIEKKILGAKWTNRIHQCSEKKKSLDRFCNSKHIPRNKIWNVMQKLMIYGNFGILAQAMLKG